MIIPAELMNVIHAGGLRLFLLEQCSQVLLIDTQALAFDKVLQGTVMIMAVKRGPSDDGPCGLAVRYESDNHFLDSDPTELFARASFMPRESSAQKWMDSLLTLEERAILDHAARLPFVRQFSDVADVGVGIVTGANKFFLVPDSVVEEYNLQPFAKPMFGRSAHCHGVVYSREKHNANRSNGLATNFIRFGATPFRDLPAGAKRYILEGENKDLHQRYKCRIRTPWYDVPSVHSSELSLLKRCHEIPRLIVNEFEALTTDTAYRVYSDLPARALAVGFFSSLTALSAELAGRAYGGGVLELVPSEIRTLLIPVVDVTDQELRDLDARLLRRDSVEAILKRQDNWVLLRIPSNVTAHSADRDRFAHCVHAGVCFVL